MSVDHTPQLEDRDRRLQALRAALAEGLAEIDRGETVSYSPETMERLKREAEEDASQGTAIDDAVTT